MPTETELKLAIDPSAVASLLRHPALRSVRRGRMRTARLVAHYYDTVDARLARDDVALRVRHDGRRWIQTLKGPAEPTAGAGLQVRGEWEWPLPDAKLDPALLAATPWRKLIAKATRRGRLARSFTTEFERRTLPLVFADGTLAAFCIDRGEIRAVCDRRLRRVRISEVEIELMTGDAANLYRLALALQADLPLAVMTDSKAARGHALRCGRQLAAEAPIHAARVALEADVAAEDALALIARECLHQIAANAPGLLAEDDPEWIHQMRVGTRRLRSCLSLLARVEQAAALDELRTEVKWLAETLGRARDWDVLVTQTLPPLGAAFRRGDALAPGVARVRARAAARRRSARVVARVAVASPRFQRLLLAAGLLCATTASAVGRAPDATSQGPDPATRRADAFAAELLTRRHRKLCEHGAMLARASAKERHLLRIAAKRLRYAADFFAPLFARRRARAYLEMLSELQDVLGQFNDAATASALSTEIAGTKDEAAAAAIRGWAAAQGVALAPRLAKAWGRFQACEPFWH